MRFRTAYGEALEPFVSHSIYQGSLAKEQCLRYSQQLRPDVQSLAGDFMMKGGRSLAFMIELRSVAYNLSGTFRVFKVYTEFIPTSNCHQLHRIPTSQYLKSGSGHDGITYPSVDSFAKAVAALTATAIAMPAPFYQSPPVRLTSQHKTSRKPLVQESL